MEKMIRLKTAAKQIAPGITEILVKRGNRIEAKIYPPNHNHPATYQIVKSGMMFERETRAESLEFVRKSLQEFLNIFTNAEAEGVSVIMIDNETDNLGVQ